MMDVSLCLNHNRGAFVFWKDGVAIKCGTYPRKEFHTYTTFPITWTAWVVEKLVPFIRKGETLGRVVIENWSGLTKYSGTGKDPRPMVKQAVNRFHTQGKNVASAHHDPLIIHLCSPVLKDVFRKPNAELLICVALAVGQGFCSLQEATPVIESLDTDRPESRPDSPYWEGDYFNFRKWIPDKLRIRTKRRTIEYLVERPAQSVILDAVEQKRRAKQPVEIMVLKSRQLGATTIIQALLFALILNLPNASAFIVSHTKRSASTILAMCRRFYYNLGEGDWPPLEGGKPTKEGLRFSHPHDSELAIATAGGEEIGRSDMLHYVHASEVPFWENAEDVCLGLWSCIPGPEESWDTIKIQEGTANGATGYFYDEWNAAHEPDSTVVPIFTGFLLDPLARHEIVPRERFELDGDELDYFEKYKDIVHTVQGQEFRLTMETMKWARWTRKRKCKGSWERFNQEYPITAEVAFLFAGYPIFNRRIVQNMLDISQEPLAVGDLVWDSSTAPYVRLEEERHGKLQIWAYPVPGRSYSVAMDPSQGVGADYAVCKVIDDDSNDEVASWHDNQTSMAMQGLAAFRLAVWYNWGKLAIENNVGHSALVVCEHGMFGHPQTSGGYPNLYCEIRRGKKDEEQTEVLGFTTTQKSKRDALDLLRRVILEAEFHSNNVRLLNEMLGYSWDPVKKKHVQNYKDPKTGMGHDDEIMAAAIGQEIRARSFEPGSTYFGKPTVEEP